MKTINVLWVDDSKSWVDSELFKIEDRLTLAGAALNVIYRVDGDGIAQIALTRDIHLVLMDYHLEPFFGNELIAEIRYHSANDRIPVIFYSQDPDVDLGKLVEDFSRVRCIPRNEVGDKILQFVS
jgi:response regulator RpfG family c-di-GMP phosphodiesterase